MVTSGASLASGSTIAVGWIIGAALRDVSCVAERAHQLGRGRETLAHSRLRDEPPNAFQMAVDVRLEQELIARAHRALEARIVDPEEVDDRVLVRQSLPRLEREDRRRLGHRLDHHDPGHDWAVREMARKERLVDGDVLEREDALSGFAFDHTVDQEEGVTVREVIEDLLDVHCSHRPRSSSASRRSSARILSAVRSSPRSNATVRRHSRLSVAGITLTKKYSLSI